MSTDQFINRYVSGKPRRPTAPVQTQSDTQLAVHLLGSSREFARSFLSSGMLRPTAVKVALAPRIAQIPGRPGRVPSYGTSEAVSLRQDGLVQKVVFDRKSVPARTGYVVDSSPLLTLAKEGSWRLGAQALANVVKTAASQWAPTGTDGELRITVIELPLGGAPLRERLIRPNGHEFPVDLLLRALVNGEDVSGFVGDVQHLFVCPPDCSVFTRIDPTWRSTDNKVKLLAVLAGVDKIYRGLELSTEERAEMGVEPSDEFGNPKPEETVAEPVQSEKPVKQTAEQRRKEQLLANLKAGQEGAAFRTRSGAPAKLGEILKQPASQPVKPVKAPGKYLDDTVSKPRFDAVTLSYLDEGTYDRDMASVISSLAADKRMPLYVEEIRREPSSDSLNLKETLTIRYRDTSGSAGRTTTVHVDLPIVTRDGYVFLNGVKWNITKQILAMPIIKVRPDEVLITTAYNKATVTRFGQNVSHRAAFVRQLVAIIDRDRPKGVSVGIGSAASANSGRVSAPEYDDIARTIRSIRTPDSAIFFSRLDADAETAKRLDWAPEVAKGGDYLIGWMGDDALAMTPGGGVKRLKRDGSVAEGPIGIDEAVVRLAAGVEGFDFEPPSVTSRKYSYSRTKMLSQFLPTAVIAGYVDGLRALLDKSGVEYRFVGPEESRRVDKTKFTLIRFQDSALAFSNARLRDTLLFNGLRELSTEERPVADYEAGGNGWVDHIADRLGSPGHARALINFETSFIDPMTRDLLAQLGLPTDMGGVLVHANAMLEDNQFSESNDLKNYRIRGPELINSILYKTIHKEMEKVRNTRESATPQRLNIHQGEIIRNLLSASNVEEVADLNPLLEVEGRGKASWTGASGGLGDGRTVNRAMRSYHPSMKGVFGFYSPDSDQIGVKRTMAVNAKVVDTRGRLGAVEGTPAGDLGFGELLSPFTATHADPPRIGMQSKQGTHTMPVLKHTPALVGCGAERTLPYAIGNTFAYKARADGKVEAVDEKNRIIRLKHDDGSVSFIDTSVRSVKNSGGGFFISSQLGLRKGVKVGSRFKKGDILAYDPSFFGETMDGSVAYKAGLMVRTAFVALDQTYEDSLVVTNKLIDDTVAEVTMMRSVSLGPKANLQRTAAVGDKLGPNDALAVFENVSDDADVSALLGRIGQEFDEAIEELARNVAVAKYAGEVVEIRTYYNRDEADLSDSLRGFLDKQRKLAESRKKATASAPADEPVRVFAPEKVTRNKVHGEPLDGVLILFFIKTRNKAGPGDKYVSQAPLKGIVARVFEEGEEPYSEDGKQVDYILSPLSIISRMTSDAFLQLWTNAVLVGLKEQVVGILKGDSK